VRDVAVFDVDIGVYLGGDVNANVISNMQMSGIGQSSRGRWSHSDFAPRGIFLSPVMIHTQSTKWRLNDPTVHG
jgi:hypothetical protein